MCEELNCKIEDVINII
ncbi:hypothetical protein [Mesomycoplasma ovipneumoniae]